MIAIVNGPLRATARRARFRSTPTSSMTRAIAGFPSATGELTAFASHCFFFVMFGVGADCSGIGRNSRHWHSVRLYTHNSFCGFRWYGLLRCRLRRNDRRNLTNRLWTRNSACLSRVLDGDVCDGKFVLGIKPIADHNSQPDAKDQGR